MTDDRMMFTVRITRRPAAARVVSVDGLSRTRDEWRWVLDQCWGDEHVLVRRMAHAALLVLDLSDSSLPGTSSFTVDLVRGAIYRTSVTLRRAHGR